MWLNIFILFSLLRSFSFLFRILFWLSFLLVIFLALFKGSKNTNVSSGCVYDYDYEYDESNSDVKKVKNENKKKVKELSWEEKKFLKEADLWGLSEEDRRIAKQERMSPDQFVEAEEYDDEVFFVG